MTAARKWQAPRMDEGVLAEPPLEQVGEMLASNRVRLDAPPLPIFGQPLALWRRRACEEARAAAVEYLRSAGEPIPAFRAGPLLLAGHQPELFHPGVWVKNFALHSLARKHGCIPLNLVVDNDTAKSTTLRVPARRVDGTAWLANVPFDSWEGEVPYEERRVQDEALFASFADRVAEHLGAWKYTPLLPTFWSEVKQQAERTPLLGERFAAARRWLERQWGCHNLEVPLSAVCGTETFCYFVGHILGELPRFHKTYNDAVHEYRKREGIRSRNHPVPDLARDGGWLELPLWGWKAGQTRRGRLFARRVGDVDPRVELRTDQEEWPGLAAGGVEELLTGLRSLRSKAYKVRSRALTTTLFARLFLGDLFIHGIGGGKYDELTDELIRRFYGIEPPAFLVLSATLNLPLPRANATAEDRIFLARQLRDLHYNPQRHLAVGAAADPVAAEAVAAKSDWIARVPENRQGRRRRFQVIRELTDKLRPWVADETATTSAALEQCDKGLHDNAVLMRRDYGFCLFPEEKLRTFCSRFL